MYADSIKVKQYAQGEAAKTGQSASAAKTSAAEGAKSAAAALVSATQTGQSAVAAEASAKKAAEAASYLPNAARAAGLLTAIKGMTDQMAAKNAAVVKIVSDADAAKGHVASLLKKTQEEYEVVRGLRRELQAFAANAKVASTPPVGVSVVLSVEGRAAMAAWKAAGDALKVYSVASVAFKKAADAVINSKYGSQSVLMRASNKAAAEMKVAAGDFRVKLVAAKATKLPLTAVDPLVQINADLQSLESALGQSALLGKIDAKLRATVGNEVCVADSDCSRLSMNTSDHAHQGRCGFEGANTISKMCCRPGRPAKSMKDGRVVCSNIPRGGTCSTNEAVNFCTAGTSCSGVTLTCASDIGDSCQVANDCRSGVCGPLKTCEKVKTGGVCNGENTVCASGVCSGNRCAGATVSNAVESYTKKTGHMCRTSRGGWPFYYPGNATLEKCADSCLNMPNCTSFMQDNMKDYCQLFATAKDPVPPGFSGPHNPRWMDDIVAPRNFQPHSGYDCYQRKVGAATLESTDGQADTDSGSNIPFQTPVWRTIA